MFQPAPDPPGQVFVKFNGIVIVHIIRIVHKAKFWFTEQQPSPGWVKAFTVAAYQPYLPAVLLSLAMQCVFRGFKDTKTPLYATVAGDVANIILDPILIFVCKLGVSGAAISHVIASTICVTLAASFAARLGAKPMAAFQICLQVWMTSSLLADGLAVAGQAIIATSFAEKNYEKATATAVRVLQMGAKFIQKGRRENIFKEVFGEIEEEKTKILLENRPFVCTSFIF
ncbi:hypothetical protein LXL04_021832 [Taraxacum kok-saghyz]